MNSAESDGTVVESNRLIGTQGARDKEHSHTAPFTVLKLLGAMVKISPIAALPRQCISSLRGARSGSAMGQPGNRLVGSQARPVAVQNAGWIGPYIELASLGSTPLIVASINRAILCRSTGCSAISSAS